MGPTKLVAEFFQEVNNPQDFRNGCFFKRSDKTLNVLIKKYLCRR